MIGQAPASGRLQDGFTTGVDRPALAAQALLLGRVTYQEFADSWPPRDGEFADRFNNMPKYVISSTLNEAAWNNTTVLSGDAATEAANLRETLDGDIHVHGSAQLVQTLIDNDLVDEMHLMVFPVILGSGKRLFGDTGDKKNLRLTEARSVGDGVAILILQRA